MPLKIVHGAASEAGKKEKNENFFGAMTPDAALLASKGIAAAIADGVGGSGRGREAAEHVVLSLLSDYYDTPETWGTIHSLDKLLASANRWLLAQGAAHREFSSMASSLSFLVLRNNRYTLAHVGDTRIYRLRENDFSLLTKDHVWEKPGMNHVLKRAVGLDVNLLVDYGEGELKENDIFLLASDGVWEALGQAHMQEILRLYPDPPQAAAYLVKQALAAGSTESVTALVLRVDETTEGSPTELFAEDANLAAPPPLRIGQKIDGLEVVGVPHQSARTVVYKVWDESSGRHLALKTLPPELAFDHDARQGLLKERWLGKKVLSPYFPEAVSSERPHFLYCLMTYHEGETLARRLDRGYFFRVDEAIEIGIRLGRAIGALHRMGIIHCGVNPGNVHLGNDGKIRLLDFATAVSHGLSGEESVPEYRAPELFREEKPGYQSDLYSLGITLYHMLTRKFPYGDAKSSENAVYPTRHRPDIPQWLNNVILKAVAKNPDRRFETAEEFLYAMEQGEAAPVAATPKTPLAGKNLLRTWKIVASASILVNLFLLYLAIKNSPADCVLMSIEN